MAEKIKLIQGDVSRPQVQATLTNEVTETVINITGATAVLKFRQVGATTLQDTVTGVIPLGTDGNVIFPMTALAMSGSAGDYEGEIQVTFSDGSIQTVYDLLKFKMREDF